METHDPNLSEEKSLKSIFSGDGCMYEGLAEARARKNLQMKNYVGIAIMAVVAILLAFSCSVTRTPHSTSQYTTNTS